MNKILSLALTLSFTTCYGMQQSSVISDPSIINQLIKTNQEIIDLKKVKNDLKIKASCYCRAPNLLIADKEKLSEIKTEIEKFKPYAASIIVDKGWKIDNRENSCFFLASGLASTITELDNLFNNLKNSANNNNCVRNALSGSLQGDIEVFNENIENFKYKLNQSVQQEDELEKKLNILKNQTQSINQKDIDDLNNKILLENNKKCAINASIIQNNDILNTLNNYLNTNNLNDYLDFVKENSVEINDHFAGAIAYSKNIGINIHRESMNIDYSGQGKHSSNDIEIVPVGKMGADTQINVYHNGKNHYQALKSTYRTKSEAETQYLSLTDNSIDEVIFRSGLLDIIFPTDEQIFALLNGNDLQQNIIDAITDYAAQEDAAMNSDSLLNRVINNGNLNLMIKTIISRLGM